MQQSNKGKPINTSVPSIAIRFHANAEELEELYQSEEESIDNKSSTSDKSKENVGESESSPLRSYLPRIGKRSTSIDTSFASQDSSPPSDRWKFFSEIKGKITKSVEDTITEIKQRNQENENSTKKAKLTKDKDNSSLSDSEDMSESSISKTCGAVSTTEGVEMSTDDETPSLEKDKKPIEPVKDDASCSILHPSCANSEKQKFKFVRKKKPSKEGFMPLRTLTDIYEFNTGLKASISDEKQLTSDDNEVESGVEALEDDNFHPVKRIHTEEFDTSDIHDDPKPYVGVTSREDVLHNIADSIDNVSIEEQEILSISEVSGSEIRYSIPEGKSRTFLAPKGFVDMRTQLDETSWQEYVFGFRYIIVIISVLLFYFSMSIPMYLSGFIAGILLTLALTGIYNTFFGLNTKASGFSSETFHAPSLNSQPILEIPAVKEYQPISKFEGWMNEYPDLYNPENYHISQTQSVYIRLQGHLLRISHTRSKIPKRAMWNEQKHKHEFTHHRIYNLLGAKISLLPDGLNNKRHWSKKYPICVTLNKDQLNFDYFNSKESLNSEDDDKSSGVSLVSDSQSSTGKPKRNLFRRKNYNVQPQIFSKLTEEEEDYEIEYESSRPSTPSPPLADDSSVEITDSNAKLIDEKVTEILKNVFDAEDDPLDEDDVSLLEDWGTFTPDQESPNETRIYLFGRTNREKEDWFRRFVSATHRTTHVPTTSSSNTLDSRSTLSDTPTSAAQIEGEYIKYMARFQKKKSSNNSGSVITGEEIEQEATADVLWINALVGRVLFDCIRDEVFMQKVKDRIQRKLSSIRLPYFIEQLTISELSLGSEPPLIQKISSPVLDQRGLWIDLDITYEGLIELTLLTKLNLMKLKQPPGPGEKNSGSQIAKWQHSDVDDTAESSTDDDMNFMPVPSKILDESTFPVAGSGGTSNRSKKFVKMVDKIAESKIFQAATENRYIKKAMEGVSNTDLGLKVEVKGLFGTLVLNMPPPPSDRIWFGFRPTPKLWLKAQPIVGERNISFLGQLTTWIEKKLSQEFQKLLVIPNMEDIVIPVMCPKLPE